MVTNREQPAAAVLKTAAEIMHETAEAGEVVLLASADSAGVGDDCVVMNEECEPC